MVKFRNQNNAQKERNRMYDTLKDIFNNYKNNFLEGIPFFDEDLKDQEKYVVTKLLDCVTDFQDSNIIQDRKVLGSVTEAEMVNYLQNQVKSGKWGGTASDYILFAYLENANIFYISEILNPLKDKRESDYVKDYSLQIGAYRSYEAEKNHDLTVPYFILFYEYSKGHYSAVMPATRFDTPLPLPICSMFYSSGKINCEKCAKKSIADQLTDSTQKPEDNEPDRSENDQKYFSEKSMGNHIEIIKENPSIMLKRILKEEHRRIDKIDGDGSCFFRSLAKVKSEDENNHQHVRDQIYNKLKYLFYKYKDNFENGVGFSGNDLLIQEKYVVSKLVNLIEEFHAPFKNESELVHVKKVTETEMNRYISYQLRPGVWGGRISDQILFAHLENVNLFYISEIIKPGKRKTDPANIMDYYLNIKAYRSYEAERDHDVTGPYFILFYELSRGHYSAVMQIDTSNIPPNPVCSKIYSTGESISCNICPENYPHIVTISSQSIELHISSGSDEN